MNEERDLKGKKKVKQKNERGQQGGKIGKRKKKNQLVDMDKQRSVVTGIHNYALKTHLNVRQHFLCLAARKLLVVDKLCELLKFLFHVFVDVMLLYLWYCPGCVLSVL